MLLLRMLNFLLIFKFLFFIYCTRIIIFSETPAVNNADNTVKSLKNLIRTIGVGLPTSPLLGRKGGKLFYLK